MPETIPQIRPSFNRSLRLETRPEWLSPDYSSRKHKMSKRARHVESDQRVTGYPQKTAETRPG